MFKRNSCFKSDLCFWETGCFSSCHESVYPRPAPRLKPFNVCTCPPPDIVLENSSLNLVLTRHSHGHINASCTRFASLKIVSWKCFTKRNVMPLYRASSSAAATASDGVEKKGAGGLTRAAGGTESTMMVHWGTTLWLPIEIRTLWYDLYELICSRLSICICVLFPRCSTERQVTQRTQHCQYFTESKVLSKFFLGWRPHGPSHKNLAWQSLAGKSQNYPRQQRWCHIEHNMIKQNAKQVALTSIQTPAI